MVHFVKHLVVLAAVACATLPADTLGSDGPSIARRIYSASGRCIWAFRGLVENRLLYKPTLYRGIRVSALDEKSIVQETQVTGIFARAVHTYATRMGISVEQAYRALNYIESAPWEIRYSLIPAHMWENLRASTPFVGTSASAVAGSRFGPYIYPLVPTLYNRDWRGATDQFSIIYVLDRDHAIPIKSVVDGKTNYQLHLFTEAERARMAGGSPNPETAFREELERKHGIATKAELIRLAGGDPKRQIEINDWLVRNHWMRELLFIYDPKFSRLDSPEAISDAEAEDSFRQLLQTAHWPIYANKRDLKKMWWLEKEFVFTLRVPPEQIRETVVFNPAMKVHMRIPGPNSVP